MKADVATTADLVGSGPLAGRRADDLAFFIDVDGTLLDFAETPGGVTVSPGLSELLARLFAVTSGAVAFISGRPLGDLDRLFPDLGLPAAGQHGAEFRRAAGEVPATPDAPPAGWAALSLAAAKAQAAHPRLLFEFKGRSIAIHFRRHPALAPVARWLALRLAGQTRGRYVAKKGHYVEEVRLADTDKGRAIERFLAQPPFAGRLPVFVGDDVTDEDGFRWLASHGGITVKVGGGMTAARWRLRDPAAVRGWLADVVASLESTSSPPGEQQ